MRLAAIPRASALIAGTLLVALCLPIPSNAQSTAGDSARLLSARADSAAVRPTRADRVRALALWMDAVALYERAGQREGVGRTLGRIGNVHEQLGQRDSAFRYLRRALAVQREAGDRRGEATTLSDIGVVFANTTPPDSAIHYFRRALVIRREVGDRGGEGRTLLNIAHRLLAGGALDSADLYYRQALAIHREVRDSVAEVVTLGSIGGLQVRKGRPDSALYHLDLALTLHRAMGDRRGAGRMLANIGVVYRDLGRRDSALHYYLEALALHQVTGDRLAAGTTLNNIGETYAARGVLDSAADRYQQALAIRRDIRDRVGEASTLNNLGMLHARAGRLDSAQRYLRAALAIHDETGDRRQRGSTLHGVGMVLARLGQRDSAAHYYAQALAVRRAIGDRIGEGETLHDLALLYADPVRAAAFFDSAAAAYADVRGHAGGDANAIAFAERTRETYARWALAWLAMPGDATSTGRGRAAWAVAERGRAQALLDLLRPAAPRRARADDTVEARAIAAPGADLVAEADSILAPLRRTRTAVLSHLLAGDTLVTWLLTPAGDLHVARTALDVDSLAASVDAFRASLDVERPTGPAFAFARTRAALAALDAPTRSHAASGDPGRRGADAAARATAGRRALARLADLLLPPEIERQLARRGDLVVVPDGSLALVPFGALPVGRTGEPLGVRYAVRFAPSLAALGAAERRPAARGRPTGARALVVGNPAVPAPAGQFDRLGVPASLPASAQEARHVARRLGARALTGRAATESAVWARLPGAPLAHFATHAVAFTSDSRARDSYLVLAPDSVSDGLLTVGELLDDPALTLSADLVVLSACETGLGYLPRAEGIVGLERAFLGKGARSVLASLWRVDDAASAWLMDRFYAHWLDDRDAPGKAEALRRAQRDMRREPAFSHPRYWAAFQLVGAR